MVTAVMEARTGPKFLLRGADSAEPLLQRGREAVPILLCSCKDHVPGDPETDGHSQRSFTVDCAVSEGCCRASPVLAGLSQTRISPCHLKTVFAVLSNMC